MPDETAVPSGSTASSVTRGDDARSTTGTGADESNVDGDSFHLISLHTSYRYWSGNHADCFHGPSYRHSVNRTSQEIRFDPTAYDPPIRREETQSVMVLVAKSWYERTGTCGSDNLTFASTNGSFVFELVGPWWVNFSTDAGGGITLENGTRMAPGQEIEIRNQDSVYEADTRLYNGGLWPRNAIRPESS